MKTEGKTKASRVRSWGWRKGLVRRPGVVHVGVEVVRRRMIWVKGDGR